MILCDESIDELVQKSNLINFYTKDNLQPASYDLMFGYEFIFPKISFNPIKLKDCESVVLEPNDFVLGTTFEKVTIPNNIVGRVEGKSSVARCGLLVHITAGFIDPGFTGNITLELKNIGDKPISIKPLSKICQISFEKLDKECSNPYNEKDNHYQNQSSVKKSRYELIDGVYVIE